jgi:quercetin dioxygenase-like cupin family protein
MSTLARMRIYVAALCIVGLAVVPMIPSPTHAAPAKPAASPAPNPETTPALVQSFDKAEELKFSWGWIRWLMSSKIHPESEMTFGLVHVNANVENPAHVHPNCEEHLHVLSGSCEHRVGKKWFTLKKGDTIRIPTGVPHQARTLKEPMLAVIVYSAGERQFELVEEGEKE